MKKFSFVAKDCNVIVSAANKAAAVEIIRGHGYSAANTKNVFLYR